MGSMDDLNSKKEGIDTGSNNASNSKEGMDVGLDTLGRLMGRFE